MHFNQKYLNQQFRHLNLRKIGILDKKNYLKFSVPFRLADPRASVYDADSSLSAAIDAEPIEVAPAVVDGATDDEGHGEGQIDGEIELKKISLKKKTIFYISHLSKK